MPNIYWSVPEGTPAKQAVLAWADAVGPRCAVEWRPAVGVHGPEVVIDYGHPRFDQEGRTGLVCTGWRDALERIQHIELHDCGDECRCGDR